jgi:hypothetical protein
MTDNVEVTQADREFRAAIFKHIIEALDRPCSDGDMIDDRNNAFDLFLARHRLAATASNAAMVGELVSALEAIQRWREDCASYDEECGHPERLFCEDVELIENYAEGVLERHYARAKASEVQP